MRHVVLVQRDRVEPSGGEAVPRRRDFWWLALGACAVAAVAAAQGIGDAWRLVPVGVSAGAFFLRGRRVWIAAEGFALLVVISIVLAASGRASVEIILFNGALMVLGTSSCLDSTRRALAIAAVGALAAPVVNLTLTAPEDIGWEAWSAASVFTFLLGRLVRRERVLVAELEATRDALAERAVAEERRRIARDLHDLAGHTLAAVLLHVNGARHLLRRDPDGAGAALDDAVTVGRRSLEQLRATVAVLRRSEPGGAQRPGSTPGADAVDDATALADGSDLGALVDGCRRAGVDVSLAVDDPVAGLDGPTGVALHRIAREALTNVARHAPGNRVRVNVAADADDVVLTVDDRGRPAVPAATGAGHHGLLGMRERALALGGHLEAGPTDTGWRVVARLPASLSEPSLAP